jgi:pimeloyl-ACP methyl ester carboxylesterase
MKNHLLLTFLLLVNIVSTVNAQGNISEDGFIQINGISQWITIHGEKSKPVIMFLHGGPGSPMSPYSDTVYQAWEKDFIIVQWDQRGTGKTFGLHAPVELDPPYLKSNPLTVEQMTADGITVTEYLIKHLGKRKVILFGSSWGSVLGVLMASQRPDLYYVYIGHSQVVDPADNFIFVYNKVYKMAGDENDKISMDALRLMGPPPYETAKSYGQLLRIVKKFERQHAVPAPDFYWRVSTLYDNAKDEKDRADGDDYSFVNYVGDKKMGIEPMMTRIHFSKSELEYKLPVFFLQGEEDILTSKEITKPYFEKIRAPKKTYIMIPHAAHGFNQSVIDTQYKVMRQLNLNDEPIR